MTWPGYGGLIGSELIREIEAAQPSFAKLDRLLTAFLVDCVYRGYNLDYLTSLFDRYLPEEQSLRPGLLHVFRRLHSLLRHEYRIFFVLNGASSALIERGDLDVASCDPAKLDEFPIAVQDRSTFTAQMHSGASVVLSIHWKGAPDAGAAAEAARTKLQEIVDYLDFDAPMQRFELAQVCLVTWEDTDGKRHYRLHPDERGERWPNPNHAVEIDSDWAGQLGGLAEALRWSSVARRERTPEVSLLACWFGFEFLAGNLDRTPVEGMMEFFPRTLAIGNLRRRLTYWARSVRAQSTLRGARSTPRSDATVNIFGRRT